MGVLNLIKKNSKTKCYFIITDRKQLKTLTELYFCPTEIFVMMEIFYIFNIK